MEEGTKINHSVQSIIIDSKKIHDFEAFHPSQESKDQQDIPYQGI